MRWLLLSLFLAANESGRAVAMTTHQTITATLDHQRMTVRLVDLPHRPGHRGVFIYLPDGTPRFLGSGFDSVAIESLSADPGLVLHVRDATNQKLTLRCDFHGFPLECE